LEGYYIYIFIRHEFVEVDKDVFVGCEFDPDIYGGFFLDVADDWVELDVFLCLYRLQHFETHRVFAFVVEG
jgi:hypothetical protein